MYIYSISPFFVQTCILFVHTHNIYMSFMCALVMMQIVPEVESFTGSNGVRFVDGDEMAFDAVIFATGYRSNVPCWLKARTSSPAAATIAS